METDFSFGHIDKSRKLCKFRESKWRSSSPMKPRKWRTLYGKRQAYPTTQNMRLKTLYINQGVAKHILYGMCGKILEVARKKIEILRSNSDRMCQKGWLGGEGGPSKSNF